MHSNSSIISNFYLSGEPILLHLLRYSPFVVKDHNFMRCALHLQQPRLVNNPGLMPNSILIDLISVFNVSIYNLLVSYFFFIIYYII